MINKKTLNDFLFDLSQDPNPDEFMRKHADPVLLAVPNPLKKHDSSRITPGASTSRATNPWNESVVYLIGDYGSHAFKGSFYCIGSFQTNDIVIEDETVSHSHASIFHDAKTDDKWYLKDSNSTNGTFAREEGKSEERITGDVRYELVNGLYVRFGDANFQFYLPKGFYEYLSLHKRFSPA